MTLPTSRVTVDWRRLKAVVLESDDWGLCAWVPDPQAHEALAGTPAFRSRAGRLYGRSTLERADDVAQLVEVLLEFHGGDGMSPVWQANTVMGSPDYARLIPPFACDRLPLLRDPEYPSRWRRPGLREAVEHGRDAGVWWPELHGLVHLPEHAWLMALRAGVPDAIAAHAHQCFVCAAVEAAAEYDPSEPKGVRSRAIAQAVEWFRDRFGRAPLSLVAPDYRWDEWLERDAGSLGLSTFQGRAEQAGRRFGRLRHALARRRWRRRERGANPATFNLPARIAFEPRGAGSSGSRLGALAAHRAVRAAWAQDQPAMVSSHRLNYAHLDSTWSAAGRRALADLLRLLARDGAVFLTDAEVRSLDEHGWSLRPLGPHASFLRYHGPARSRVTIPVPAGAAGGEARERVSGRAVPLALEPGGAAGDFEPGEYRVEWTAA